MLNSDWGPASKLMWGEKYYTAFWQTFFSVVSVEARGGSPDSVYCQTCLVTKGELRSPWAGMYWGLYLPTFQNQHVVLDVGLVICTNSYLWRTGCMKHHGALPNGIMFGWTVWTNCFFGIMTKINGIFNEGVKAHHLCKTKHATNFCALF